MYLLFLCLLCVGYNNCDFINNYYAPCKKQEFISKQLLQRFVTGFLECAVQCSHLAGDVFVTEDQNDGTFTCSVYKNEGKICQISSLRRENVDRCYKRITDNKNSDPVLNKVFGDELLCIDIAGLDYTSAQEKCESFGARLVTITSREKQDFLHAWSSQLIAADIFPQHQIIIGGYWDGSAWMWVSDVTIETGGYEHFATRHSGAPRKTYECLAMNIDSDSQWISYGCVFARPYFCEKTLV